MDNTYSSSPSNTNIFSNKNTLIIVLIILLLLSFLGINLISITGNLLENIVALLTPLVNQIFYVFGNTTGMVINKTTDVLTDTAKVGVDIAGGTLHNVGNLLQNSSEKVEFGALKLDNSVNTSSIKKNEPANDSAANPIQNPITSAKTNWCLVGEYQERRGCIEISDHDKCLSGQVFPNQKACLNPTYTNNMDKK